LTASRELVSLDGAGTLPAPFFVRRRSDGVLLIGVVGAMAIL
jgi:hypothetical protein